MDKTRALSFDDVNTAIELKRRSDSDYRCKCPAHNGSSDDSLSVSPGDDGRALLHCFSGCTYEEVVNALKMPQQNSEQAIRQTGKLESPNEKPKVTAVYQYCDEQGQVLFEKVRYEPKSFKIRQPAKNGQHKYELGEARRVLYNLPAVISSNVVFIVEGEKDADRLNGLGLTATCNFEGASKAKQKQKWMDEYTPFFEGKDVYILPDNDEPGDAHSRNIKRKIVDVAKSVKVVGLPGLKKFQDVSDWLDSGKTVDDLWAICKSDELPSHKWKLKTLKGVFEELTPTEYIIDPILPKRSVSIWYGAPGSLKSMILMDMVFTILSESEFIPGREENKMLATKANILWIDLDNGEDVLKERIAAMARTKNISEDEKNFTYVCMPDPWLFIAKADSQMDLKMLLQDAKFDLVIIDNLSTITGDIDENSAAMAMVMAPLRAMTVEHNTAFILIHHSRKGGAVKGGRAGDALRGHSVIEGSIDYAIQIFKDERNKETSKIIDIKCTKARRFKFDDFKAQYNFTHKSGTNDLDTVWFSSPSLSEGTNDVYDAILKMLKANDNRMTKGRLVDAVRDYLDGEYGRPTIGNWLKEMEEMHDVIKSEKGDKNAIIISLKNE